MRGLSPADLATSPRMIADQTLQDLREQLGKAQREQARLAETAGEKHPEMIRVRGVLHTPNGSRRLAEGEIIRLADGARIASGKSRFLLLGDEKIKD